MADLRLMWGNTRMVVLCAISAALYAAVLVPFKALPIIPGITELRPANAIPVVCSFLFGPAAGWGSAIGNMIGDFFGGVGPGDVFGFFGNLFYGYVPYKMWRIIADGESPVSRSPITIIKYVITCLIASILCADFVGWGDNMLALRPFSVLGNLIVINNATAALVLSPFILYEVYPRVSRGRMLYADLMPEVKSPSRITSRWGLLMLAAGTLGAWITGNLVSTGFWFPHFLPATMGVAPYDRAIAVMVSPFMVLAVVGVGLM
jgi:energy-coupling factor transport system substrate-specific component